MCTCICLSHLDCLCVCTCVYLSPSQCAYILSLYHTLTVSMFVCLSHLGCLSVCTCWSSCHTLTVSVVYLCLSVTISVCLHPVSLSITPWLSQCWSVCHTLTVSVCVPVGLSFTPCLSQSMCLPVFLSGNRRRQQWTCSSTWDTLLLALLSSSVPHSHLINV